MMKIPPWQNYAATLSAIENASGLDLFSLLRVRLRLD